MIAWFGRWNADAQLRFTSKFADVAPLLAIDHGGRTGMRASINPRAFARFEGGTGPVAERLTALRRMALAGYPVDLPPLQSTRRTNFLPGSISAVFDRASRYQPHKNETDSR